MAQDEEATLRRLHEYRKVFSDIVVHHGGTVFGVAGDSEMAIFVDAGDAVRCGLELQETIGRRNSILPRTSRMPIRVGVNFGQVIVESNDVYGDEVNITARLESFAEAGEVCISGAVFDLVRGKLECGFDFFGKQRFKNIDRPVRAYRVRTDPQAVGQVISTKRRRPQPGRYWRLAAAVSLVALLGATIWGVRVQIEKQHAATSADELILETRQSVGEAQDQIERLLDRLQKVSDKASNEGERTNALLALLQQAQDTAENQQHLSRRRSAEIRRLLELLDASESRAAAERARADDLFKVLQEAEQTTTAQNIKGWDESFSKDAVGQTGDQDLRETLLGSWREAEQQAALNQSRAEKLLTTVNKLEATARLDQDAVAEGVVLPDEPGAQVSGGRQRIEALLASLQQAQIVATGKREQAEDLLTRLSKAEMTVADNAAALKTLQEEAAKIESLLAGLQSLEARIADDVSSAERTLQALIEAEAAARSQNQMPQDPEPADRADDSHSSQQARAEAVLAATVRVTDESRSQLKQPPPEPLMTPTEVSSSPPDGPDSSGRTQSVSASIEQKLGRSTGREIVTLLSSSGSYDGNWVLSLVQDYDTHAQFQTDLKVKANTFFVKQTARGWRVELFGLVDESTNKLAVSGKIRRFSRLFDEVVRIEADLIQNGFSGTTITNAKWQSPGTLKLTLEPKDSTGNSIFGISRQLGSEQKRSQESVSKSYDGPWVLRIHLNGYVRAHLEIPVEVKNNAFDINTVIKAWNVILTGSIDEITGRMAAAGRIWNQMAYVRHLMEIGANLVDGAFSGEIQIPSSWKSTELLEFTFVPSEDIPLSIAEFEPTKQPTTDQGSSQESVSGLYDGPWMVRFDLGEFGFRKDALEAELHVKNGAFITNNVTSSWRIYFAGQIDDKTGKLSASGQIRDHQSDHTTVYGVFKTESDFIGGGYSGITQINTGTRMGLPQHVKYAIVRKDVPDQLTAKP